MQKYYPYLITLSHMINDSCQSVLPALLPLFIYTYGLSLEQAGFLILANTALSSLLQPLLGVYFRQAQSATTHRSRHVIIRM